MIRQRLKRRIGEWEAVRVDEEIRKCVAFLFADVVDGGVKVRRPVGTAFLVEVPMEDDQSIPYVVTARHVIDGSRPLGNLSIRFNRADGHGYTDFWAPHDTWTLHPTTDVAVSPLALPLHEFDVRWLPFELLMTDAFVGTSELSEGDEVFFSGLFVQHHGTTRSQPVFRFGNIALMPHEPMLAKLDPAPNAAPVAIDAYLVEARSWGGQSGSPAFAYFHLWRPVNVSTHMDDYRPRLLGLVHGHFNVSENVQLVGEIAARGSVPINAGMAIVVPAQKIIDLLMTEELVEDREKTLREHKAGQAAAEPDIAQSDAQETEFDRFEDLARNLVNTPKPESDEKRKEGS